MQAIRLTLSDIEHMKDGKNDKSMRLSVNRLKKQQTARLKQASPEALHIVQEQAYLDATIKSIKTLNSIRALFPLSDSNVSSRRREKSRAGTDCERNEQGEVTETTTLEKLNQAGKDAR